MAQRQYFCTVYYILRSQLTVSFDTEYHILNSLVPRLPGAEANFKRACSYLPIYLLMRACIKITVELDVDSHGMWNINSQNVFIPLHSIF